MCLFITRIISSTNTYTKCCFIYCHLVLQRFSLTWRLEWLWWVNMIIWTRNCGTLGHRKSGDYFSQVRKIYECTWFVLLCPSSIMITVYAHSGHLNIFGICSLISTLNLSSLLTCITTVASKPQYVCFSFTSLSSNLQELPECSFHNKAECKIPLIKTIDFKLITVIQKSL